MVELLDNYIDKSDFCDKLLEYISGVEKSLDNNPIHSITESRKSLEYICKSIYKFEEIKLPTNNKGYYTLAVLINDLWKRNITNPTMHATMNIIRCTGNEAAHDNEKNPATDDAYLVFQHLSRLIIWTTEKYELQNSSIYKIAVSYKNSFVNKQKSSDTMAEINAADKFVNLSTLPSPKNKFKIARLIPELANDKYFSEFINEFNLSKLFYPFIWMNILVINKLLRIIDDKSILNLRQYVKIKYDIN